MQRRARHSTGRGRLRAQDRAFRGVDVHHDVGHVHQHFLLVGELGAEGLHREAEHHQRRFLERLGRALLVREHALVGHRRHRRRTEQLVLERFGRGNQRELALQRAANQHARNQQPVDFVRALEDPVHARVAEVALGGIIADVAVAAVNLNVLVEDEVERFAAGDLGDRRLDVVLLERRERRGTVARLVRCRLEARVDEPGGAVEQALDRVGLHDHLAELVLDRAEAGDRLAELSSSGRVLRALADGAGRTAFAHRAELEAREVEDVERDLVSLADFAQHVLGRHLHVLEDERRRRRAVQAHLVLFFAALHAECALDEERREMLAVDFREDHEQIGKAAVGDPHLLAVEQEAAVRLSRRLGAGAERIRSGS